MTIIERIAELREYARQDGERLNEDSIADFLAFPQRIAGMEGPYLFAEDAGHLRAVWRNTDKRFGIEFFGEGKGQLIFEPKREILNFDLTDVPSRLTVKSLLAFAREHAIEQPAGLLLD